jgi:hypothetical protein
MKQTLNSFKLSLILILFVLALPAFSQSQKRSKITPTQKAVDTITTASIPTNTLSLVERSPTSSIGLTESEAYKLLYENASQSNDRLISTIQWALGIAISVIVAIILSQIFFNYRISKKEIDYIKKDIDEKLAALKLELVGSIETHQKAAVTDIDEKINTLSSELRASLRDKVHRRLDALWRVHDSFENRLEDKIKTQKIEIEKNTGDIWLLKGLKSNALSNYLKSALLKLELGENVKYLLDDIIAILTELEDIHEFEHEKLNKLTGNLDSSYAAQKEKIIKLYKNMKVYTISKSPSLDYFHPLNVPFKKYVDK